jgi:hypothetical protein
MAAESFALVKVIDRLISLGKYKIQNRKEVFNKVFEPAFKELEAVHGDYLEMFDSTSVTLNDILTNEQPESFDKLKSAIEKLRTRRTRFEPVRAKLRSLGKALVKEKLPPEETKLAYAMCEYLSTYYFAGNPSASGLLLYVLKSLEEEPNDRKKLESARQTLSGIALKTKDSWQFLCQDFAAAQIKVTSLH